MKTPHIDSHAPLDPLQERAKQATSTKDDNSLWLLQQLDELQNVVKKQGNEIKKISAILDNVIINLQEGILLEDANRKILLTNQLFCDLFAIPASPEALTGADCSESAEQNKHFFIDPENFVAGINLVLSNKTAVYNDKLELLDGRHFERDYIPTWFNEVYSGHLWKYRDVTKQLHAQQELQVSEERYHSIFEGSPDGILITDAETKMITFANSAICRGFGYSEEQFLKLTIADIHPQDTFKHTLAEFESVLSGEKITAENIQCLKRNGEIFYADISGALISLNGKTQLLGFFRDITVRKNSEKALKASEEKYRKNLIFLQSILESPIKIVIFSIDRNYCYTNFSVSHEETMRKIWGVDIHIGMNMLDLISNLEDQEKAKNNFDRALKGDFFILTEEYGDKELSRIYFDNYYNPVNDAEGNIVGISVFVLDVTLRRRAELEIIELNTNLELKVIKRTAQYQEALSRLEKIADRVPGVVYQYRLNPDGSSCFPFASEGIRDIFRVSPEEVSQDASIAFSRIHPDDFDSVVASIQASAKDHAFWQCEFRVKFDDETERWLLGNAMPQHEANNSVLWHGFISDITDQKRIEKDLKQVHSRLSLATRASGIGVWYYEFLNNILVWDDQMLALYGLKKENFNNTYEAWKTRFHPDDMVQGDREIQMAIRGEKELDTQFRVVWPNGTIHNIRALAVVHFDSLGNPSHMMGTNWDITAQNKTEEALIAARNEADRANLAKSDFLSRMSHELRTPMNSILGFAQLMEMDELKASHKKWISNILNSGKHLLSLINEVLELAGIESGRLIPTLEPVRISGIFHEILDVVQILADKSNVSIELIDSPADNLIVFADRLRLKQVLINLTSNAIKYNKEGGSVTIKTALKPLDSNGNTAVRISIRDTGNGIKPEDITKLFQPFELIGADKTKTEGTGLGLIVVKELIKAMNGAVGVESEVGMGSTFWIELPIFEEKKSYKQQNEENRKLAFEINVAENELLSRSTVQEKIRTILYIEDNASNTELVEQILLNYRSSIHLVSHTNGAQAVSLAIEYAPDLILLDLDLPDIKGFEVIKLLQAVEKTKEIPVVIISADAMPYQIEKQMNAGSKDYLIKPLEIMAFLDVVDKWVGK